MTSERKVKPLLHSKKKHKEVNQTVKKEDFDIGPSVLSPTTSYDGNVEKVSFKSTIPCQPRPRRLGLDSFPPAETLIAELELETSEATDSAAARSPSPKRYTVLEVAPRQQVVTEDGSTEWFETETSEMTELIIAAPPSPRNRHLGKELLKREDNYPQELVLELETSAEANESYMISPPSPKSRLLLKDWLKQQVTEGRTPGLIWIDESQSLIRIPWIHASKGCWKKDFHCKLFENWAIYSGKYRPGIDKESPKRWKANFRCALNSLPDVKEVPEMSQRNGKDGYKVYKLYDEPNTARVGKREMKRQLKKTQPGPTLLVQDANAIDPFCNNNNNYEPTYETTQGFFVIKNTTIVIPTSGSTPQSIASSLIAPNTELINDTIFAWDNSFTSIINDDICVNEVTVTTDVDENVGCQDNNVAGEEVITQLSNVDHSYYKTPIPTTVEDFLDEDPAKDPDDCQVISVKRRRQSSNNRVSTKSQATP